MTSTTLHTAADVMSRDVVTCSQTSTLKDALDLMTDNHCTGLPVVDDEGHCLGVISASDILGFEEDHVDEVESTCDDLARFFDHETQMWESVRPTAFSMEALDRTVVADVMSPEVVACVGDTPLPDVARQLITEEVHRVIVLSADDREVVGIVSAFDFVRFTAEF